MVRRHMNTLLFAGLGLLLRAALVRSWHETATYTPCPNMCSGKGKCTHPYGVCDCFKGYTGADCSLRICPEGPAWTDLAVADDTAHSLAECSNRGTCDRETGRCVCEEGRFEGAACERRKCPNNCSLRGRCVSARRLADMMDPGMLRGAEGGCTAAKICVDNGCTERDYGACRETLPYITPWEADMMMGCLCDEGYAGYDCSVRTCPAGDDPLTGTTLSDIQQKNEVQLLECQATFGTFTLSFMGQTTAPISVDANVFEFTEALSALDALKRSGTGPKISVQWLSSSDRICTSTGNDIQIEFLQNFGDLSLIIPDGSRLGHISVSSTPIITNQKLVTGDKESDPCSNRGTCSLETGVCYCLDDWTTSDGYGGPGTRGDCGHRSEGTTSSCPGEPACFGFGTCSGPPEYRCDCQEGRHGPDCSLMNCPAGKSWFSYPASSDAAHVPAECSDMGICDEGTGACLCTDGYHGGACEYMMCPGEPQECNGNGRCLSMQALAQESEVNGDPAPYVYGIDPNNALTWDYDQMRGCLCSDGFEGFDCSLRSCPKGDDPQTLNQNNEVQQLSCTFSDDDGTFHLKFRGQTTTRLHVHDTADDLQNALNALSSIERVSVSYADPSVYAGAPALPADALQICRSSPQLINIEFESPTGDVPSVTINDKDGFGMGDDIDVVEFKKGTKEYITCSGRGLCNHDTGLCECFTGFASSDGQGNAGTLRDCGFISPVPLESYNDM